MHSLKRIGLGILIVIFGAAITEVPIIHFFGYLIMLPGVYMIITELSGK
jgi:hypothetical protein